MESMLMTIIMIIEGEGEDFLVTCLIFKTSAIIRKTVMPLKVTCSLIMDRGKMMHTTHMNRYLPKNLSEKILL